MDKNNGQIDLKISMKDDIFQSTQGDLLSNNFSVRSEDKIINFNNLRKDHDSINTSKDVYRLSSIKKAD